MGMRAIRPRRFYVQRDIQMLVRTFPSERVVITRGGEPIYGEYGEIIDWTAIPVFDGEALVIPADGSVADYGLGQVENKNPQILVPGTRDIQQGDFVVLADRRYQVEFEPNHWHGFVVVRLEQYQQGQ